jgi:MoaA/NifB/PqqE/SkfB family radical SAM enzyme
MTSTTAEVSMNATLIAPVLADHPLDFLWLELTNRCNLQCLHCYADSGPRAEIPNALTKVEREQLITASFGIGCRRIQFIGGEPTLNKDLQALIELARHTGYDLIEVYSNLTHLSDDLLRCFEQFDVHVATSIYAPSAEVHDAITKVNGSFRRTVQNMRKLSAAGIKLRASIIEMPQNDGLTDATVSFLKHELHVHTVKVDRLRHFGRAGAGDKDMHELCGACAKGTLCVGVDGKVSPCIMSKHWGVGSIRETSLAEIVYSSRLNKFRTDLRRIAAQPERSATSQDGCGPDECTPIIGCPPYNQPSGIRSIDLRTGKRT